MPKGIFVLAEHRDGKLKKQTFELLNKAQEISSKTQDEVVVLLLGKGITNLANDLGKYGANKVLVCDSDLLEKYTTDAYSKVISDILKEQDAKIFLLGATIAGKDLAPRIAAKLNTGVAVDCTQIDVKENGELSITRPVYAGKAFIKVSFNTSPQIVSVRPNVIPPAEPQEGKTAEIVNITPKIEVNEIKTKVIDLIKTAQDKIELTEADIIVSGGRGMKGPENFKLLEDLAKVLGAAVGASRAAVDAGWRPHSDQVGQTGKTVSPKLYIACGISGAIQHLAGMSSSKFIVAINKDPEAPIFKVCDFGIVGDLFQVVPILTEEFKKIKQA
jgi:electron transfer flavoprotein alpha subunit